ncbi:MAG: hypothetical protein LC725_09630 [Lentisphaerae bacterium]|nr:hypothetical protein [Lentisphaerota bacterium]
MKDNRITLRAVVVGAFFAALFAAISIYTSSHLSIIMTATQIPVLPYLLLILTVFLLNPLLRLVRFVRAFSLSELMIIFIMGMVSAGIPNFGMVEMLLPMVGSLSSREWNNPQSEWNRYIVPYVNDAYFISVPGTQQAAADYYKLRDKQVLMERIHNAATRVITRRAAAAEIAERLQQMESDVGESPSRAQTLALRRLRLERENVRNEIAGIESLWSELAQTPDGQLDLNEVLAEYPALIKSQQQLVAVAQAKLDDKEQQAFKKVELYRRGLPRGMNAYPGILPLPQDDATSYFNRLRRLRDGRRSLELLQEARDTEHDEAVQRMLAEAERELASLTNAEIYETRMELARQEDALLLEQYRKLDAELLELNTRRRQAERREAAELNRGVRAIMRSIERVVRARQELHEDQQRWLREFDAANNVKQLTDGIAALRVDWEQGSLDRSSLRSAINAMIPAFAKADISLRRYFVGEIPWGHWARPLGRWALLIVMTYVAIMSLNVLIFRQWAHNEMIIYPLAELPKSLVNSSHGGIPDVFRNGLFWAGLTISGLVMGWNLLCMSQFVPGLTPFDLRNAWSTYVSGTPFRILSGMRSEVFFTMIGLAFLIPKNVSFSLWFFFVLYMAQLVLLDWSGIMEREGSAQWWYLANVRSSQGAGAMFVFAAVIFFKCRRYILCALTPGVLRGLEDSEQKELRLASIAFLAASLGIVMQMWLDMGAHLLHSIYFYIMLILMTLAIIRVMVEGGLPALQTWITPVHVLRAFFGLHAKHSVVPLFTPLMLYCGVLFLDLKNFIAPAMANAIKLRDDFHMRRGVFHISVIVAILLAAAVAGITSLLMSYDRGADAMSNFFYVSQPRNAFDTITSMTKNPPEASMSSGMWMLGGGAFTGLLIFMRQFIFWVPHPIGMVMLVNPIMRAYWFSIFLGWLANTAVTKYGHKETYSRATGLFIGLVVGELLIVLLSTIISMITGENVLIDLNRN